MRLDSTDHLASMYLRDNSPVLTSRGSTMPVPHNATNVEAGDTLSSAEVGALFGSQRAAKSAADLERSPVSDGKKFDVGKAPLAQGFWQYFGKAAAGIAFISEYGAKKYKVAYSEQNWRKVDNAKGRYADALLRHLKAHLEGEVLDPESGKPHVDHMAWNAMALSELEKA